VVTAPQRREVVEMFKARDVSERRSCELVGISRSSFRYLEHPRDHSELAERLKQISNEHKRYGYRRACAVLRREGLEVNIKRVYRVWREEGLTLPRRRPGKRRKGTGEVPLRALSPKHVWTYDFIHDATENGRKLKMLTVLDEFTRECLRIEPDRSIRADKVVEILGRIFEQFGSPAYLRSDNGSEFIADKVKKFLLAEGTKTIYIDPGSPWQNAYEESFHGKLRDECLNMEVFHSVAEARVILEKWRRHYNTERPHSSLAYMTPAEYKTAWEKMEGQSKKSLSLYGIPDGRDSVMTGSPPDNLEKERRSNKPRPSVYPPASALRSLSSVALSSLPVRCTQTGAQAMENLTCKQQISTPPLAESTERF